MRTASVSLVYAFHGVPDACPSPLPFLRCNSWTPAQTARRRSIVPRHYRRRTDAGPDRIHLPARSTSMSTNPHSPGNLAERFGHTTSGAGSGSRGEVIAGTPGFIGLQFQRRFPSGRAHPSRTTAISAARAAPASSNSRTTAMVRLHAVRGDGRPPRLPVLRSAVVQDALEHHAPRSQRSGIREHAGDRNV